MKPLVELSDVCKVYDMGAVRVHALRGVDLTIGDGEFTAVMGASGSGKSTLLNIVGCLDRPTQGEFRFDGQRMDSADELEWAHCRGAKIGFVFQNFNLLSGSSALENVELPLVYRGIARRERLLRARAALETVGLGDRMEHRPWQLSGGQQQRAALARALVTRPRLLLADEPTGNLDSKTSEEMLELLGRLHRDEQFTIILVTHDADVAALCRRVLILHDGQVVYDRPGPAAGGPAIPPIKSLAASLEQASGAAALAKTGEPA